jgi:hypothetical protein
MTVQNQTSVIEVVSDETTNPIPITFQFFEAGHIHVRAWDPADPDNPVPVEGFTVTGGEGSTGTLTLAAPVTDGWIIEIRRIVDVLQLSDFRSQGPLSPVLFERACDILTQIAQQLNDGSIHATVEIVDVVTSAANVNTAGVGVYKEKVGEQIRFRGVKSGSGKIVVSLSAGDNTIVVDLGTVTAADVGAAPADHVGAGGAAHANATATESGFFTGAEKQKLATITPGATATPLSNATPAAIGTASSGSGTAATREGHIHAHGAQAGGDLHADVVAGGASGFITGAQATKLDALPTNPWTPANDGAGSGLDADLLDGQHGAYYATASGLGTHLADDSNPHGVTALQIEAATVAALEAVSNDLGTHLADANNPHSVTAIQAGAATPLEVAAAVAPVAAALGVLDSQVNDHEGRIQVLEAGPWRGTFIWDGVNGRWNGGGCVGLVNQAAQQGTGIARVEFPVSAGTLNYQPKITTHALGGASTTACTEKATGYVDVLLFQGEANDAVGFDIVIER